MYMHVEGEPSGAPTESREQIQRGKLLFLCHPGTPDTFSGYGLVAREGRRDHLLGILMIDRPQAADPQWLAMVQQTYGDYQLVPMTATEERGIVCHMYVDDDSLPLLRSLSDPPAPAIQSALRPLLDHPPDVAFKLRWDVERGAWTSAFWIGLPTEMQAVFEHLGDGCFVAEREDLVTFVTHASDRDIQSFRDAHVRYRWELIEMPTAPLVRFQATIFDEPSSPFVLEHFLNIGDPDQARILARLVNQDELCFDFFGDDYEYRYSKHLPHPANVRNDLDWVTAWATNYWASLAPVRRDFDRAKAEFMRQCPP